MTLGRWIWGPAMAWAVLAAPPALCADARVMFFGDSNTWGQVPFETEVAGSRFDADTRWTGVAARVLGPDVTVVEQGLPGRTSGSDDPSLPMISGAGMNGARYISPAVATATPLDVVAIMLGTNDVKTYLGLTPLDISLQILDLATEAAQNTGVGSEYAPPQVLIVAPPPLGDVGPVYGFPEIFDATAVEASQQLASTLGPLAEAAGFAFFDAGSVVEVMDGADGVHMTPAAHETLGTAIAGEVARLLP